MPRASRQSAYSRQLRCEPLELRRLLSAGPIITEFMASNDGALRDGNGATSDWVEVFNAGTAPVDTTGTLLTGQNTGGTNPGDNATLTVGGVTFTTVVDTTIPLGGGFTGANPGNVTTDANFDSLLNTASFGNATLTLTGLTAGTLYQSQFFVTDSRGCCSSRTVTVNDGVGNLLTSPAIGNGYVFNGMFTADAATRR